MEVVAALGLGAKELFSYNRENFKFDQDQRIERETLRLEMQVKRFELFREDVRDLVELTVDRMDVYHLVGALFLEFCIVLFCEGRVQASAPPFLLSLFLLSNACAFIYLLLAVWLSMHASIASHSFGVRLLTRFVRLPIPSVKQIGALRSQLRDYERQGVANLLRVPFLDKQEWTNVHDPDAQPGPAEDALLPEAPAEGAPPGATRPYAAPAGGGPVAAGGPRSFAPSAGRSAGANSPRTSDPGAAAPPAAALSGLGAGDQMLLPEEVDLPLGGEDLLSGYRGAQPERHVQLFRQLQSKWQCYDAYCRVCMGLGVNQILQGLSYYCICHTLVENHSPTTGYALVALFQCTTVAIAVLDLAGLKRHEIVAVQVVGVLPCALSAWGVAHGQRDAKGVLDPEQDYMLSPLSFLCQVLWLELWLRVAAPSGVDEAKLPRRFRQVLFLDVFGDAVGWDPTQAEDEKFADKVADGSGAFSWDNVQGSLDGGEEDDDDLDAAQEAVAAAVEQASRQLTLAQCAMRRWKAVPDWCLSTSQRQELDAIAKQLDNWGNSIRLEVQRHNAKLGRAGDHLFTEAASLQRWRDLSAEEKSADPFAKCLLGPFQHDTGHDISHFHYEVESQQTFFGGDVSRKCPGALVLALEAVRAMVVDLEREARGLLERRITTDLRAAVRQQQRTSAEKLRRRRLVRLEALAQQAVPRGSAPRHVLDRPLGRRRSMAEEKFPNLASLFGQGGHGERGREPSAPSAGRGYGGRGGAEERAGLMSQQDAHCASALDAAELRTAASAPALVGPAPTALGARSGASAGGAPPGDERHASPPRDAERPRPGATRSASPEVRSPLPRARARPPGVQDPTLVAMAGKHARHFVPERLPWQVLSRMTRVLQLCWGWSGLIALLKELGIYQVDFQQHIGGERRRLAAAEPWAFEPLLVEWPLGAFFRPQAVLCLPGGGRGLLVASPYAMYTTNTTTEPLVWLEEVDRLQVPESTALLCDWQAGGPAGQALRGRAAGPWEQAAAACLLAAPAAGGVQVWRAGADLAVEPPAVLPIDGAPWRLFAGAAVPCAAVALLISAREAATAAEWCALLAGWDGAMLPVAVVPLPAGPGQLPRRGARVRPSVDAPLPLADAEGGVAALTLEPLSGRLWAVLNSGDILAWDLFGSSAVGRWRPAWPHGLDAAGFLPVAACEDPERGLFVIGRSKGLGAVLLAAEPPWGLASGVTSTPEPLLAV